MKYSLKIFGFIVLYLVGFTNPIFAGEFGSCPENCNNQGDCVSEMCVCNIGFTGVACEILDLPLDDGQLVGGELVSLDTTTLLLVGTQITAAWMIPVIVSAAGIGMIIVAQKTKLKRNPCPSCKLESDDIFELGDKTVGKCDNPKCRVSLFFIK